MQPYHDAGGDSGVVAYEGGRDFIRVQFKSGAVYLYTNESAGDFTVARMKSLAAAGDGLSAFIARQVKDGFERKER